MSPGGLLLAVRNKKKLAGMRGFLKMANKNGEDGMNKLAFASAPIIVSGAGPPSSIYWD